MDKNYKRKVKDFFRKEGFYFVLFICLCVIATVVVFTVNKNNKAKITKENEYGIFYAVDVKIGIDRKTSVTTIWNTDKNSKIPQFITAYPKR